jgi:lincosamide and streptogramin A transport system ATP-binding/permease protein
MSIINVSNLTFSYESSYDNIFEDVSFHIDTDWKLGFIGRNGRGKTTFLNLLMKKYSYSGTITSSCKFEYFPYHIDDDSMQTMDIINRIYPDFQRWELERELSLLHTKDDIIDRPFYTLSKGEQTKVLLAALFLKENSFLLIDEPTNHLDMNGRKLVSEYLNKKKGFILVSHDREFLDKCVDHILSINKADIEVQNGNFTSFWNNKTQSDNFELAENIKLRREIKRLEKTSREKAVWSDRIEATKIGTHIGDRGAVGHRAAKMMKRSKAIEKRQNDKIEDKSKLLKNIEQSENLKITQLYYHSDRLLFIDKLSIFYDGINVCNDICLTLNKGDRVSIQGQNGSGKTSVLKLVLGKDIQYTGTFNIASGLVISYISQDTSFLTGNLSHFIKENSLDETLFKAILRKLDFNRVQFEKDIDEYSQGQKKKVLIAKSLCEKAHLLIWDEPLNYIDLISRIQIENVLLEYKPTILFVEHDKMFCNKIANKSVKMSLTSQ